MLTGLSLIPMVNSSATTVENPVKVPEIITSDISTEMINFNDVSNCLGVIDTKDTTIKVNNITTNSASLIWGDVDEIGMYYIYTYNPLLDEWEQIDSVYGNSYKLDNIFPAQYIEIQIRNQADAIIGSVNFQSLPESVELEVSTTSSKKVCLKWNNLKRVNSYEIYRIKNNGTKTLLKTVEGNKNSFEDTDVSVKDNCKYEIITIYEGVNQTLKSSPSNTVETTIPNATQMGLPSGSSGVCKTYAYYTAVTVKSSPAYAVLNSGTYNGVKYNTYTDEETGIRMVDDCYCAALGTYYGTVKGTKYLVTLENGNTFKIILCDTKADIHTDSNHQYSVKNKDIIEFYVEKSKIPNRVIGSYNSLPQFNGAIKSIEKINE